MFFFFIPCASSAATKKNATSVHEAIHQGNRKLLKSLLSRGGDANARDASGTPALCAAVEAGCPDSVEQLLGRGADVDARLPSGATALHVAVGYDDLRIARLLLAGGAEVNARSEDDWTPLHLACRHSAGPTLALLLASGAEPGAKTRRQGLTPLHVAALHLNDSAVRLLLERDCAALEGGAGLVGLLRTLTRHDAQASKRQRIVEMLLARRSLVNRGDEQGRGPVFHAVQGLELALTELLLAKGARANARDARGHSPLHLAALLGSPELVRLLLAWGAEVGASLPERGSSALHLAAGQGHCRVVEVLVEAGADIDARDSAGCTPLHRACEIGRLEAVEVLLENGADMSVLDERGNLALYAAVNYPHFGRLVGIFNKYLLKFANLYPCKYHVLNQAKDRDCYYTKCRDQLESMKTARISESDVTFYDILAKSTGELASCFRNKHVVGEFRSGDYKQKFSEYAKLMANRFNRGRRRLDLLDEGNERFYSLFPMVPHDCARKILDYLDDNDLRLFVVSHSARR